MKLSLVRVLPLAIALLVPSAALAEEHNDGAAPKGHVARTAKRAKSAAKPHRSVKAPKAAKKAPPKAAKKAPKASKKAAAK